MNAHLRTPGLRPGRLGLGLCLLVAACGGPPPEEPQGPSLPPPQLAPLLDTLKQLQASQPLPDEATQRELTELADIALGVVETDQRLAGRAERSLLEHPDGWFPLERALEHDDVGVRRRAAWFCGRSGQTFLLLPLLLRLKYEKDPEAVVWVADALEQLGNDEGLAWLESAMTVDATAQIAGERAIEICRDRDQELTGSPTYDELRARMREQYATWRRTGVGGRKGVAAPAGPQLDARLARHLATPENLYMRPIDDARFVLTRAGKVGVPMLTRTLSASEHYLRTMVLQILVVLGPCARDAGPAVLALLPDPKTALYAVRALGEIGDTDAIPYLRPLLGSFDTELRSAATQALGLLGDEASRAALVALMADETEAMDVRVGAAFALCCLGGDDAAAKAFLDQREQRADYHLPTLQLLREKLAGR